MLLDVHEKPTDELSSGEFWRTGYSPEASARRIYYDQVQWRAKIAWSDRVTRADVSQI